MILTPCMFATTSTTHLPRPLQRQAGHICRHKHHKTWIITLTGREAGRATLLPPAVTVCNCLADSRTAVAARPTPALSSHLGRRQRWPPEAPRCCLFPPLYMPNYSSAGTFTILHKTDITGNRRTKICLSKQRECSDFLFSAAMININ